MEIVHAMTKVSTAAKRNFSMNDLRQFDRNVATSGGFPSFQRNEAAFNRPSGNLGYMSDGSFEGMKSSPFEGLAEGDEAPTSEANPPSSTTNSLAGRGIAGRSLGGLGGGMSGRNSMSMSSLSTAGMPSLHPTSSTYEQYLSNVDEAAEEEEGGIFF
ncbi:hypothetical protein GQ600_26994 [Phytophthora cactorum]|nr:hypothetical protein GQ600_26994 [Phytophthora cactorum]